MTAIVVDHVAGTFLMTFEGQNLCHIEQFQDSTTALCGYAFQSPEPAHSNDDGLAVCPSCGKPTCPTCAVMEDLVMRLQS